MGQMISWPSTRTMKVTNWLAAIYRINRAAGVCKYCVSFGLYITKQLGVALKEDARENSFELLLNLPTD